MLHAYNDHVVTDLLWTKGWLLYEQIFLGGSVQSSCKLAQWSVHTLVIQAKLQLASCQLIG